MKAKKKKFSVLTSVCVIYFCVMLALVVMRILSSSGVFSNFSLTGKYLLNFFTQFGFILVVPAFFYVFVNKKTTAQVKEDFRFEKIRFVTALSAIALGVVVFILNTYVSTFFNSLIQGAGYVPQSSPMTKFDATWVGFFVNLFCTAVVPAICEEVLHRGMLVHGFTGLGMKKAVFFSGILFGLLHLNIEQFFYATMIGWFLAYICIATNSIYPCIIVHFMNNGLSVFFSFARARGWAIGNFFTFLTNSIFKNFVLGMIIMTLFLILMILIAWWLVKFAMFKQIQLEYMRQQDLFKLAVRENFVNDINRLNGTNVSVGDKLPFDESDIFLEGSKDFERFMKDNVVSIVNQTYSRQVEDLSFVGRLFFRASIALGGIVTLMTFIWGML